MTVAGTGVGAEVCNGTARNRLPWASAICAPNSSVDNEHMITSAVEQAAIISGICARRTSTPMRMTEAVPRGPEVLAAWPRFVAATARGSCCDNGWKSKPALVISGPNRSAAAMPTSCPAARRRAPSPA
ncbi:hypothetical protein BC739_009060 [Kutzneria viridogrisea]|uniref:Uncharacterized protein n=1 Tax=Kutzneria viridogrisea TaxID=47990 RepID=A0ABR6BY01_9PSEU|nr:hypothetical protein [Kutzneria viridogrisea]